MDAETLILCLGIILLATRALGWLFQRMRQPAILGEMIAGIVLGPSLFGRFFPNASSQIFTPSSVTGISALSGVGLLLFMFWVGLEVDLPRMLKQGAAIAFIGSGSVIIPLVLGTALGPLLYSQFAGPHIELFPFALFMGAAMSVTAFPVLARILQDSRLLGTDIGGAAISCSCAAINDVTAWLLLAILTALGRPAHGWRGLAGTLLWLPVFLGVMIFPVRRAASLVERVYEKAGAGFGLFSLLLLIIFGAS